MLGRNIKILLYALLLAASSFLIYLSFKQGTDVYSIITNLCYGVWPAALMGLAIEISIGGIEKNKIRTGAGSYLFKLYFDLKMVIGSLIILNDRLDDENFNWELKVKEYFTSSMETELRENYTPIKFIKYSKAKRRLKEIGRKSSPQNSSNLNDEEKQRLQKMFKIISHSSVVCIDEIRQIYDDKLLLQASNICSVGDIEKLYRDITQVGLFMGYDNWEENCYSMAIDLLIESYKTLKKIFIKDSKVPIYWIGTYGDTAQEYLYMNDEGME